MNQDQNPAFPDGEGGRTMLTRMNAGHHEQLANWTFANIPVEANYFALDLGCGGGANVARMLAICPQGSVSGIDYAPLSVEMSQELNAQAIEEGRCDIFQADVADLPFGEETFDLVTAFETVYFWPNLKAAFLEVSRVCAKGARFVISNEVDGKKEDHYRMEKDYPGLRVYTYEYLSELLLASGFSKTEVFYAEDGEHDWMNVVAYK